MQPKQLKVTGASKIILLTIHSNNNCCVSTLFATDTHLKSILVILFRNMCCGVNIVMYSHNLEFTIKGVGIVLIIYKGFISIFYSVHNQGMQD